MTPSQILSAIGLLVLMPIKAGALLAFLYFIGGGFLVLPINFIGG